MDRIDQKPNKKKRLLILGSITAVVAILVAAVLFLYDVSHYRLGVVTNTSAKMKSEDEFELKIKYSFLPVNTLYARCPKMKENILATE